MPSVRLPSAKALHLLHERQLLPVFPGILTRLDTVLDNPNASKEDVANVVAGDVLLAARLMQTASSTRYGATRAHSLLEAVARLGLIEVKAIAFAVAFSSSFSRSEHIEPSTFWQHAFVSAVATRVLNSWLAEQQQWRMCDNATAFLLGLSHDMGMLLLDKLDPQAYARVIDAVAAGEDQLLAEQTHLGTTHALMSAALLHHWRFSDQMSTALAAHHYPLRLQQTLQPWADLVLLGEAMAVTLGYTNGVYSAFSTTMQSVVQQRQEALQLHEPVWHELSLLVSSQLQDEGWLELANGV